MNRRGQAIGRNTFSLPMLLLFTITVLGPIVGAKFLFLAGGYSAKQVESDALYSQVYHCLLTVNQDIVSQSFKEVMFEQCAIHEEALGNYLILIDKVGETEAFWGKRDYETQCYFDNPTAPSCATGSFVKGGETYRLFVATNNPPRKVYADF